MTGFSYPSVQSEPLKNLHMDDANTWLDPNKNQDTLQLGVNPQNRRPKLGGRVKGCIGNLAGCS